MPIDVVIPLDDEISLSIEEVQHIGSVDRVMAFGVYLRVRAVPKGSMGRVAVVFDHIFVHQLRDLAPALDLSDEQLFVQIALEALGRHLDSKGLPPISGEGERPELIAGGSVAQSYFERRKLSVIEDEQVLAYMATKLYWGWRFGMSRVSFGLADAHRLGVPLEDMARVALAGDKIYWTRADTDSLEFSPTARLISDVPAGLFPGRSRPFLLGVVDRLGAPRYQGARELFQKSLDFLNQDPPDLANGAKEAAAATEALALTVLSLDKGTLGDCIKELGRRDLLSPPLRKSLEGLWGYVSDESGIRHGKRDPPAVRVHEATFAINLAAAAVGLLLELDR